MHIKGFEIYNFQSHEKTVVDLKDGINVFVGTSDSGKSAVLRALKWNLLNTPSGNEFIRKGTTEAAVVVHFSDGHSVERKRSTGSKNTYTLLKDGEIIEEYTGFGSKVPKPILEVTKINPDFSFNFANQLEAPFLLSETPKVRAETIGNLEELGKIDSELGKLNDDVRSKKQEQRSQQNRMKELESERNQLVAEINTDKEKMETLKTLKESIAEKQYLYDVITRSHERIVGLGMEIKNLRQTIERATRITGAWNERLPEDVASFQRSDYILSRLLDLKNEASLIRYMNEDKLERLLSLSSYVSEVANSYQQLVGLKQRLDRNAAESESLRESFSPRVSLMDMQAIDAEVERFSSIFTRVRRLKEIDSLKKELDMQAKSAGVEIDRLLTEFVEALHDAQTCPTCFQTTNDLTKHELEHSI